MTLLTPLLAAKEEEERDVWGADGPKRVSSAVLATMDALTGHRNIVQTDDTGQQLVPCGGLTSGTASGRGASLRF